MLKPSFVLLTIGLFALAQGGCGDGSANADGSFITGDVDGATIRAELSPGCGTFADGRIWAEAEVTLPGMGWTLYMNNSVGTTDCSSAYVELGDNFGDTRPVVISTSPGATCSVTVTAAAPAIGDVLEGTFSMTVPAMPPTITVGFEVTNGAFRVRRASP
jgi:hypothetical protein